MIKKSFPPDYNSQISLYSNLHKQLLESQPLPHTWQGICELPMLWACPLLYSILTLSSHQMFISLFPPPIPWTYLEEASFLFWVSAVKFLTSAYQLLKEKLSTFCTFSVYFCCLEWILEDCKKSLNWMSVYTSFVGQGYTSTTGVAFTV